MSGTSDTTRLAVIVEKVTNIENRLVKIENKMDTEYVTRGEVNARVNLLENTVSDLKKIIWGLISLVVTSVIGGALMFYINAPK